MTRSIVVPLDGTSSGERALPFAFAVARRARVPVHFVHVQDCFASLRAPVLSRGIQEQEFGENGRDYLNGLRQRLLFERVGDMETATIEGNAVDALQQYTRNVQASLIVLAIEEREDAERLLVDDSGATSSAFTLPPFLFIPANVGNAVEETEAQLTNLLLPMDDATEAEDAVEPALDLMRLFAGKGAILHVIDDSDTECGLPFKRAKAGDAAAVDRLFEARFRFEEFIESQRRRGIKLDLKVVENAYPGDGILEEAETSAANWIAISCKRRRRLSQQIFGSTASRILQESSVPVLACFSHEG